MLESQYVISLQLLREKIKDKESYPFSLPVVRNLSELKFHPRVTFLVGENGTGKSTLLEAIAVHQGFNAEGGSKNFNFSTNETHSKLHEHIRIAKGYKKPRDGGFFCEQRRITILPHILMI